MFGNSGLGAYGAAAGIPGWGGLPPGFPPTSSAAGLASLAAAQQAQQAAALASLGPAAGMSLLNCILIIRKRYVLSLLMYLLLLNNCSLSLLSF